jgi:hypothetical protein
MATHAVKIIQSKQLNDGLVAVLAQCCEDDSTLSWLTMAASVAADPNACQHSINEHCGKIAGQHDLMLTALAALPKIVGTTTTITVPAPVPVVLGTPATALAAAA